MTARCGAGKYKIARENVAKSENNGIIETNNGGTAGKDVHTVGRIDRNIYRCITEDITTDEVIITDERIKHVKDRHPNDYERYFQYMKSGIEKPDYIIKTDSADTALILKTISDNGKNFRIVLRLHTSSDNPDFKNSIITFMKIKDKEYKRLLKNKKILYKSE